MDLRKAERMAKDLMGWHGLSSWSFQFDRAVSRLGQCSYSRRIISLGLHATTVNEEAAVLDTILHEVAHALAGHQAGHGPEWKAVAKSIGCNATRTGEVTIKAPYKWLVTCKHCQKVVKGYYRQPNLRETAYHGCKEYFNQYLNNKTSRHLDIRLNDELVGAA